MRRVRTIPRLDDREWSVVASALEDAYLNGRPASVQSRAGPIARLASAIFGRKGAAEPCDAKTDAVRRFVWACLHRSPDAVGLMPVLQNLGFTTPQIDALALLSH